MNKLEQLRVRDNLSPNSNLPNSLVYSPIETWTNDDVWVFLNQVKNPWGYNNKDLLTMYKGASPDGECPLVVDSSTPSCGDSRFGCWVCTMVEQDKSMAAMIQNDAEKEWMLPLLELRNELDVVNDKPQRDFRRINGRLHWEGGRLVHGPYKQSAREHWLRRLLGVQRHVREHGPANMRDLALITPAELAQIRLLWVVEKHEIEDSLPRIYEETLGEPYPGPQLDEAPVFSAEDMAILRDTCGDDELGYQLARELLDVEQEHRAMLRRAGLYKALEEAIERSFFEDEADAEAWAARHQSEKDRIQRAREEERPVRQLPLIQGPR
jgi:DNA sulfur modification protein DndC